MARTLRFSFDFISPYAYLAWAKLHDFAARHRLEVEAQPVLFAALLDAYGHKGPAEIPPKRVYTFKHVVRLAADQGLPLRPPPAHPFNPLLGLRIAALALPPTALRGVIDVLFARVWASGTGITDPVAVAEALTAAGHDGAGLVKAASQPEAKARLRALTDAARERGVFGVPTLEVDGELFWGQDSFGHIERFLRGEDPATAERIAQWEGLPAQAQRKHGQR
ncbi:MAG: 2-hydroxychromene-2-carboxylate isomerase [Nannocystaceae bacterium]|nr:2-hydroxychromene-2-carboxylate isomerase [bacterium]